MSLQRLYPHALGFSHHERPHHSGDVHPPAIRKRSAKENSFLMEHNHKTTTQTKTETHNTEKKWEKKEKKNACARNRRRKRIKRLNIIEIPPMGLKYCLDHVRKRNRARKRSSLERLLKEIHWSLWPESRAKTPRLPYQLRIRAFYTAVFLTYRDTAVLSHCRRGLQVCFVCVFFPFILDFNGRTSRGHTGRR